jgi:hypothetical protein
VLPFVDGRLAPVERENLLEISAIDVFAAKVELHAALDLVAAGALQERRIGVSELPLLRSLLLMALLDNTFVKPLPCCKITRHSG